MNSPTLLLTHPDVVLLGLDGRSAEEAIEALHARLAGEPGLISDPERFRRELLARARIGGVCVAPEVAVPHARSTAVERLVLAVGRLDRGVPFDAAHPEIRLVFLIGTPNNAVGEYLQLVAALMRRLRNPEAREGLLRAADEAEFRALLAHAVPV